LIAATLALEGVLIGTGQFAWLACSMLMSTTVAAYLLTHAPAVALAFGSGSMAFGSSSSFSPGVVDLWRGGLSALFALRFFAAACRLLDRKRGPLWSREAKALV
jgi:hypothetical protein